MQLAGPGVSRSVAQTYGGNVEKISVVPGLVPTKETTELT